MKVLLVDDDLDLLDVTGYALRRAGCQVSLATDGAKALAAWRDDPPDVVVLDLAMPRPDGFEVLRRIRAEGATPVILLTAFTDDERVVRGFRLGADDYVTKPFSTRQLLARMEAACRRGGAPPREAPAPELRVGELTLDPDEHGVRRDGALLRLTRLEFRILHILALNAGKVVATDRLVAHAWGYVDSDGNLLKSHLSNLRRKLGLPKAGPGSIRTLHRVGYCLVRGDAPGSREEPAA